MTTQYAHPWVEKFHDGSMNRRHSGMTLRDYFAAHAPAMPRSYLEHMQPDPDAYDKNTNDWHTQFMRDHDAWEKHRLIVWAWAYANAMMKARGP